MVEYEESNNLQIDLNAKIKQESNNNLMLITQNGSNQEDSVYGNKKTSMNGVSPSRDMNSYHHLNNGNLLMASPAKDISSFIQTNGQVFMTSISPPIKDQHTMSTYMQHDNGGNSDSMDAMSTPTNKDTNGQAFFPDKTSNLLSSEKIQKIQWKTTEVEALLDCVEQHLDDFRGRMVHVRVWRQIGGHLSSLFTHITPPHCYNKWKNLRRDVRLALSNPQRVLRNPAVLVRAAHLAAQVYPSGTEADPEFLRQVDALLTNSAQLGHHAGADKKMRNHSGTPGRRKKASLSLAPTTNAGNNNNHVNQQQPPPLGLKVERDDRHHSPSLPQHNGIQAYLPVSASPVSDAPSLPEEGAQLRQQHQTSLLASFLAQQQQLSPQSSMRTSTPGSNSELNPILLNQALLIHSANMLQNLQRGNSPCPRPAAANTNNGPSNNNQSLNSYPQHHFQPQTAPSPPQPHHPIHQHHDQTSSSNSNQQRVLLGPNGQRYLPTEAFDSPHHQRTFVSTPSTQSLPGGLSNPSSSPESGGPGVVPQQQAQQPVPRLSLENLRDLVVKFRNDESNRISMLETLIGMVHDLRSDSERRLDILNHLMTFAQYRENVM